jgi:hypothetical protein
MVGVGPTIDRQACTVETAATGSPDVVALALAVVAGGMAGDQVTYRLGARAGRRVADHRFAQAKQHAERARSGDTARLPFRPGGFFRTGGPPPPSRPGRWRCR